MNEEKLKKEQKNLKIVIIVGIIISIIVIGVFVCILAFGNNSNNKKKDNKQTVEPTATPKVKQKDLTKDSEEVVKLLDNTIYYYSYHNNYYKENKVLVSKIDYKTKMKIILDVIADKYGKTIHDPLDSESTNWTTYTMKKADFEKEFYNFFGEDAKYEFKSISGLKANTESIVSKLITNNDKNELSKVDIGSEITFDGDNVTLKRLDCCGDHGLWNTMYKPISTITKIEQKDSTLNIYEKPAFFGGSGGKEGIYKDAEYKQLVGDYTGNLEDRSQAVNSILEYLDTYKYSYSLNDDGSYHLVSVEKVEEGKKVEIKPTPTPTPTPEPTAKKLDVNSDLVKNLYEDIMPINIENLECGKYVYYNYDKFLSSELKNGEMIQLTAKKLVSSIHSGEKSVSKDTFDRTLKQLFGKDAVYSLDEYDSSNDTIITVSVDGNNVRIGKNPELGDLIANKKINMIISAEQDEEKDEIYIYEKPIFAVATNVGYGKVYNKCEYQEKNDVSKALANIELEEGTTNWVSSFDQIFNKVKESETIQSKLYTYKFIFKSNGNGTYYFYGVEKVK